MKKNLKLTWFKVIAIMFAFSFSQYSFSQTDLNSDPGPIYDGCAFSIFGLGTPNSIPRWISSSCLGSSIMQQDSKGTGIVINGNLNVNMPSYLQDLNVEGNFNALGYSYFDKSVGMNNALNVSGQTILNKVNVQDDINILGYSHFSKSVGMDDVLTVESDLTAKGNTTLYGNLYVGTHITGDHQLIVNGKISANEIEVLSPGKWGDEVFKSNYNLLPLKKVENYVKHEKHLPEFPSESEVLTNGYKINDLNVALLKKVEELTLYVIQLQKEIDTLKIQSSKF